MTNSVTLAPHQVKLVKQTIAHDCNDSEFSLFMEAAKSYGLDPFRKQIMPLVFSKGNADKRRMAIVVSRDGLRVIAQRCGDYRPASDPAEIERDDKLKSPTNPKGIIRARVRLFKADRKGDWYPVIGEAEWDEFAPVVDEWAYNQEEGKRRPTGKQSVEGNWQRMPVVMITKCAEAQALRAGWPDQFGGLYVEEEMEKTVAVDAAEIVRQEEERERLEKIGGVDTILMTFGDNWDLQSVPVGKIADRCSEFIRESNPEAVLKWSIANKEPLRQFWARAPGDAMEVKKQVEAKIAELKAGEDAA